MTSEPELGHCGEQVRRYDPDRFLLALLAPPEARARLLALYAFNVELSRVAEIATEPTAGLIRLQWWRETLDSIAAGAPRAHPVAAALARAMAEADLPRPLLDAMIDAREQDLEPAPPAALAALERYVEGSAGSLGELTIHAVGGASSEAVLAAREAGIGYGLVGLVRAIGHHARHRRLFLPADLLAREGVNVEALFRGESCEGLRRVVSEITARAAARLDSARRRRADVPAGARPALLTATLASCYLRQLRRSGNDPLRIPVARPPLVPLRLMLARALGRY